MKIKVRKTITLMYPWSSNHQKVNLSYVIDLLVFQRLNFLTSNFVNSKLAIKVQRKSLREKGPYSGLFWSAFSRTRTEYGEILRTLRIYSECGKMRTRTTPNTDTFYVVTVVYSKLTKEHWVDVLSEYI